MPDNTSKQRLLSSFTAAHNVFLPYYSLFITTMAANTGNGVDSVEERFRVQTNPALATNPLETNPATYLPHNTIPNTPLASATIAFLLGGVFSLGLYTTVVAVSSKSLPIPYQLGFYIASWAFFHWAEFAVTAGWNLEKCSIDCMSLFNSSFLPPAQLRCSLSPR